MENLLVVGAGQAAASLVARLRAKGFDGAITLVGEEPVPPYQRPPLSKAYLLGEMPLQRLFLRPEQFYADNAVTLRLGQAVTGLDAAARQLTLEDGESLSYDALALCTGAEPRRLPEAIGGALKGVHVVRDLADADAMADKIKPGRRAVIIGGGYIGLEAAAVAAKLGLEVTLIEAAPRILNRVASAETADYFRALHQSHGVTILEDTRLDRLTGDDQDQVTGVTLEDGTHLPADLVIAGIGIVPRSALAEAAGLTLDNGIAVDAQGRTSDPAIWAAGDCAAFPVAGGHARLESVGNAIDMGELVADNLMGNTRDYTPKPWFWSDQYDVKLQIAGLGTGHDRIVLRQGEGGARSHWYYAGEQLLALDAMNDPRGYMVGKRLIEAGRSPDPVAIADPETDLKALLRA